MLLTKKVLEELLDQMRVSIPQSLERELLEEYGNYAEDDEGHIFEYTDQDIYEQLEKKVHPYKKSHISNCISF